MRWRNCKKRGRKQESERKGKKTHAARRGVSEIGWDREQDEKDIITRLGQARTGKARLGCRTCFCFIVSSTFVFRPGGKQ